MLCFPVKQLERRTAWCVVLLCVLLCMGELNPTGWPHTMQSGKPMRERYLTAWCVVSLRVALHVVYALLSSAPVQHLRVSGLLLGVWFMLRITWGS
jgi:hypothetical protein